MKTIIVLIYTTTNILGFFSQNISSDSIEFIDKMFLYLSIDELHKYQYNISDTSKIKDKIFLRHEVDQLPKFQSKNYNDVIRYINKNIQYSRLYDGSFQGVFIVSFIVTKDGNIEQIKAVQELYDKFDNEVIRILSSTKEFWTPGMKNNEAVNTMLVIHVEFYLNK